ncbi:type II secretion system F family protein [Holzapfeliella sp. He02]|uniref:Type II secretion system F family protein n=1 Tax=Holzapfeliella saturejae TaxID=3082953 RepID=A0ABU8SGV3_9LACO
MKKHLITIKKDSSQQLLFMKYLKMYLESHFSFSEAIGFMALIWPKQGILWFDTLSSDLKSGRDIHQSLLKANFNKMMSFQIQLALKQGTLIACLTQLITLTELQHKQMKKIKSQLSYPIMLFGLTVVGFFFIQQTLNSGFLDSQPSIIESIVGYVVIVVVSVILALIGYLVIVQRQQKQKQLKFLLKWPVIGKIIELYSHYVITFNLSYLVGNDYQVNEICRFLSQQNQKESLQQKIAIKLDQHLKKGLSLKTFVEKEAFLPNRLIPIIESGKSRQTKSQQVKVLNQIIYEELLFQLKRVTLKIQPICFILIGLFVLGLYLKILMPLYGTLRGL